MGSNTAMRRQGTTYRERILNWPTPRTRGLLGGSGSREMIQTLVKAGQLDEQEAEQMLGVKLWPTPTAVTDTGGASLSKWGGSNARKKLKTMVSDEELFGALNPTFPEWLMGWPIGWTALEPLATDKYQQWLEQHG
jgi:hypothetical protein